MKRFNRPGLIALIVSSLVLLAVFQVFWLKKVYDEQFSTLKKDLDHAFRTTVMGMQDSMIQTNMTNIKDTSCATTIRIVQKKGAKISVMSDSFNGSEIAKMVSHAYLNKATPPDSTIRMARMMVFDTRQEKRDISIRLDLDSLRIDDIVAHYKQALLSQNIDLPFRIHRLHQSQLPSPPDGLGMFHQYQGLMTVPVFAGMPRFNVYVAQIPEYQSFVFRKTVQNIFFSMILFGMTALAFGLVYRSLRQQERLTALKNDFISNITHELKTPIATVSVAIEALQNFNALQKPELTKEYLDISKNELSRLSMLVDKVLKLSVFEQKEPELKKETLDMASLVAEVLDSMRLQFEKLGVKIAFDTEGAHDTFIEADKTHLTSVIYNLLDNAIKYEGKNIQIQFSTDQNRLKMRIADDGCGIATEYQSKIFDKFFRVPKGDVHNVKGYGLGLSYVASILKQHGGRIEVESVLGRGSIFSVFLPKK
jgi:two-component system, OmpR family, phosphate regulon sensor histidine kinase PhoR